MPWTERLWGRVVKTDTCWLWTGGATTKGYGTIVVEGRKHYVHRFVYELMVGPIPDGLHIDHLCRVRNCVNPSHLEPVTNFENHRRTRQVLCRRGHVIEVRPNGRRRCMECGRINVREWRARAADTLREATR